MNLAYQHLLLAMWISFVTSANAEPVKTEFLINNNDIEKCIGTTNATPTLSFPPGSKVQRLVPCLSNGFTRWQNIKPEQLYNLKQNKCLGVLNRRYGDTGFWPVITNACGAPYTRWQFEPEINKPGPLPTRFKVRNIELGTCLGVIEPDSETPVVVLVRCEDQFYTLWSEQ